MSMFEVKTLDFTDDFKKIKNCRVAIDKWRNENQKRLDKIATVPDESKELAKVQLETDRTHATEKLLFELIKNGFGSVSEFKDWYDTKILEIYQVYRPIKGLCDWCGRAKFNTQPCAQIVGRIPALSCAAVKDGSTIKAIYGWALDQERKNGLKTICPSGHGYQQDIDNYIDLPDGIDFMWRV